MSPCCFVTNLCSVCRVGLSFIYYEICTTRYTNKTQCKKRKYTEIHMAGKSGKSTAGDDVTGVGTEVA